MRRASAVDIPPELFDFVLDALALNLDDEYDEAYMFGQTGTVLGAEDKNANEIDDNDLRSESDGGGDELMDVDIGPDGTYNEVRVDKRELGVVALVCRHWAKLCQKKIFNAISLRSKADLQQLVAFVDSPASYVASCIEYLTVLQKGSSPPWIHLLPALCAKLHALHRDESISVYLDNPLHASQRTARSIHMMLPRTLPDFSVRMTTLHLTNMHFRCLSDLMGLTREMPDLHTLICRQVKWDHLPVTDTLPLRRHIAEGKGMLVMVQFTECSINWPAFWILTALKQRKIGWTLLAHDLGAMGCAVQCMEQGVPDALKALYTSRACPWGSFYSFLDDPEDWSDGGDKPGVEVSTLYEGDPITPQLSFLFSQPKMRTASGPQSVTIETILVDFESTFKRAFLCDWKRFEEAALTFAHLKHVVLRFRTKDEMEQFRTEVGSATLTSLSSAGKMLYGCRKDVKKPSIDAEDSDDERERSDVESEYSNDHHESDTDGYEYF